AGFGTKPIQRLVTRIVSRHVEAGARHAEAYDAGRGAQTAVELLDGGAAVARVDVQPVAEDDVGMLTLRGEGVVVQRARFLDRLRQAHAEIEHDAGARFSEVLG